MHIYMIVNILKNLMTPQGIIFLTLLVVSLGVLGYLVVTNARAETSAWRNRRTRPVRNVLQQEGPSILSIVETELDDLAAVMVAGVVTSGEEAQHAAVPLALVPLEEPLRQKTPPLWERRWDGEGSTGPPGTF